MPNFGYDEIWHALEESVKLQSHYAELLNMHDGGLRIQFENAKDWLERLRYLENKNISIKDIQVHSCWQAPKDKPFLVPAGTIKCPFCGDKLI